MLTDAAEGQQGMMGVFLTRQERLYNFTSAYGGFENIYARLPIMMEAIAPICSLSRGNVLNEVAEGERAVMGVH